MYMHDRLFMAIVFVSEKALKSAVFCEAEPAVHSLLRGSLGLGAANRVATAPTSCF